VPCALRPGANTGPWQILRPNVFNPEIYDATHWEVYNEKTFTILQKFF
jgi:hypothetical protein